MISMMNYIGSKEVVAQFVDDLLWNGVLDYQSITITKRGKSGDYFVSIVTDGLSEGTVVRLAQSYLDVLTRTYKQNIPGG